MAKFHFVEDYEALISDLMARHPLDEAMRLAVGGQWDEIGGACADLLLRVGLKGHMTVLDFGCGSGRVAHALSRRIEIRRFLGIDIVGALLDYARTQCPANYLFHQSRSLTIPVHPDRIDFAYAFSVFTHLLQTEIFIYLLEFSRILKSRGVFVFSFLEIEHHWDIFVASANANREHGRPYPHLNMFLDRQQLSTLSARAGFSVQRIIEPFGIDDDFKTAGIGQTVAVLQKMT